VSISTPRSGLQNQCALFYFIIFSFIFFHFFTWNPYYVEALYVVYQIGVLLSLKLINERVSARTISWIAARLNFFSAPKEDVKQAITPVVKVAQADESENTKPNSPSSSSLDNLTHAGDTLSLPGTRPNINFDTVYYGYPILLSVCLPSNCTSRHRLPRLLVRTDNWTRMMGLDYQPDYAASGLAFLIALCSLPSLRRLVQGSRYAKSPHQDGLVYEDEDGAASEDSMARFSNRAQFITIFIIALLALALSVADAIVTAVQQEFEFARSGTPVFGIFLLVPAWVSPHGRGSGV
jgi:hypothetical protein